MASYTAEDAERVFSQDRSEVHEHYAHLAEQQRSAVRRAIADLTGTTLPAEDTTEPDVADDSDDQDTDFDHDAGAEHPDDAD